MKLSISLCIASALLLTCAYAANAASVKQVAITIDDLPFVGSANHNPAKLRRERERFLKILDTLQSKKAPATGFVIAGTIEKDQWALLQKFKDAGFTIGNHTYSHPSLNSTSADRYIENIHKADTILKPIMSQPKYFRYPYLAESSGKKKQQVYDYLKQNHYIIAPVTIDSKDFKFNNQLYRIAYRQRPSRLPYLKKRYLDYIWKQTLRAERRAQKVGEADQQILLIHANLINAHAIGDIVDMYRSKGYTIVDLETVMNAREKNLEHQLHPIPKMAQGA